MEPRVGRVENGAIVLDDASGLVEGSPVTVWIGDPRGPFRASREELELVARGQEAAATGDVLDARELLRALRSAG